MSRLMEGHPALDLAYFRNPLQVDVRLAATVHREQPVRFGDATVFADELKRQFQQGYVERCPGLLPCAVNPPCAVFRLYKVLCRQVAQVAERDARERRKEEYVTHKVQVGFGQRRGYHPLQFLF